MQLTRTSPATAFTSITRLGNGHIQLQATGGVSGFAYTIEAASNLNPVIQWSNLGTALANGSGQFSFTDTNAPLFPMRLEAKPGFVFELSVTNTNDAGPGSLRQAILHASSIEYDAITFAANVTNTIRLTSGELVVNKSLSIDGPGIGWAWQPGPWKLTISGNNTSRVFRLSGGELSLFGLTIADGLATAGGGIRVDGGNHGIYSCQIVSNSATGGFGFGGGGLEVTGSATLNLLDSSVTHNQAAYNGGGIRQNGSNQLFIGNCTIASNRVTATPTIGFFPHGGGIALSSGSLTIRHSTIASNTATFYGGGIGNNINPGTMNIYNSIVAGNSAPNTGPDVAGSVLSGGYNLIGNTNGSAGWGALGDQLGVNPLLGPLADYGGPTLAMALRAGSPAIDKGYSPGYFSDQRGFSRPLDDATITNASGGDGTDIGAFEVDPDFRIVELRRVGSDVALSLLTVLGRNYRAEYTNNLASGNWTIFTNNVPGNGYLLWVTNYGGANQPRRFYRAAIVP